MFHRLWARQNLSFEYPNIINQNKSMPGCNKWSVVLHVRVHLAQPALHTSHSDGIWVVVLFSSKISLGEGALLPLCCPFLENPTILKALKFSRIFSGFQQQSTLKKKNWLRTISTSQSFWRMLFWKENSFNYFFKTNSMASLLRWNVHCVSACGIM